MVSLVRSLTRRLASASRRAVASWGEPAQWRQVQEECGELVAAVNQADRGRAGSAAKLAEEVADVTIMMAQARVMLGAEVVDAAIDRKLARLERRLDASEAGRDWR